MCTAISFSGKNHYFGRNLDLEYSYEEAVTVTPRRFPFSFRNEHYAMIGMAYVVEDYPLYYDATNEEGLSMAGLHFPGNAFYFPEKEGVASFELIPFVLGQCKDIQQAVKLLQSLQVSDISFSKELPPSPLHWLLSDKRESVVIEPLKEGLKIIQNPVGVLTNNPPFETQLLLLQNYQNLSPDESDSCYSRGLGAYGLPGDLSSVSRFVKAVYVKEHSLCNSSEEVSQFFHILKSVEQQKGCVRLKKGMLEKTVYSSCCNTDRGIYYYTTYENSQVSAVDMHKENLEGERLICYPLIREQHINWQN